MPTMKDVARRAGVSVATVSRVINETRYVNEELRLKVVEAMGDLSYHPNVLARSLRLGVSHTIGLVVPDNSNPFFAEIARAAETVGFENGYSVILCNSDKNVDRETTYVRVLIAKQVDGIIFIATGSDIGNLLELTKQAIPVVVADRDIPQTLADVVLVNNEQGGYDAARYLLDLGHRSIAAIATPLVPSASADRLRGYRRALNEAGTPVREEWVAYGPDSYLGGETAMAQLLQAEQRPTAVFAYNDVMAIGAYRAIKRSGLRIPQDISIVGFDDIALASAVIPALTTVAQPIAAVATQAMHLLMTRIRSSRTDRPGQRIVLDTNLVIRESCAALRP